MIKTFAIFASWRETVYFLICLKQKRPGGPLFYGGKVSLKWRGGEVQYLYKGAARFTEEEQSGIIT